MNHWFAEFIDDAKQRADAAGVRWDMWFGPDGKIAKEQRWDLSALVRSPPPRALLSDLGTYEGCLGPLNVRRADAGLPRLAQGPLGKGWRELIKAVVIDQLLVRGNVPNSLAGNVITPLRILGTCAAGVEPWELSPDNVALAHDIARAAWPSGKYAEQVLGVVRDIIDRNHLSGRCPLATTVSVGRRNRSDTVGRPVLRKRLEDQKTPDKLPDQKALWELVRIVFTETPRSFMDVIRFAQVKVLLACGFRIEEVCSLPADWRRTREYFDMQGRPAGEVGGISRSLMVRHFAEKQRGEGQDGVERHESFQYVPEIFEDIISETLDNVRQITEPLRTRLRAQTETGRVFPEYRPSNLMPAPDFFASLFGSLHVKEEELPADLVERYQQTWDIQLLERIRTAQALSTAPLRVAIKSTWSRLNSQRPLPEALRSDGTPWRGRTRTPWRESFFRVADLEKWVDSNVPTKLPDCIPLPLAGGGKVFPYEMLFLAPKRSVLEERNGRLCDLGLYFPIGQVDPQDLMLQLGGRPEISLFRRYGLTDEDRGLSLISHSLRHLQNTELFRQGVSDLIITKRFGRKSVPQSYEYDHRTLAEDLDSMELPPAVEETLGEKAQHAYRLIAAAKAAGPLIEEFRRLQRDEGDAVAFEFLRVEADGFHTTPYGYCINSFTVDPCPKHLECFQGCGHFALSDRSEHRTGLVQVRERLLAALAAIEELPADSIGRDNQLQHTRARLENVTAALEQLPGARPFPNGPDLSEHV